MSTCTFVIFAGVKTGVKSTVKFTVKFDSEIVIFNTVKFNGVYFYVKIVITYELYRCTELNLYICTLCTSCDTVRKRIASEVTRRALKGPGALQIALQDAPCLANSNKNATGNRCKQPSHATADCCEVSHNRIAHRSCIERESYRNVRCIVLSSRDKVIAGRNVADRPQTVYAT